MRIQCLVGETARRLAVGGVPAECCSLSDGSARRAGDRRPEMSRLAGWTSPVMEIHKFRAQPSLVPLFPRTDVVVTTWTTERPVHR